MQLISCISSIAARKLGISRQDWGDWHAHPVLVGLENPPIVHFPIDMHSLSLVKPTDMTVVSGS